jgi:hypothetical protein
MATHGSRKYESIADFEDDKLSMIKRIKTEDATSDEQSEASDDRLQRMTNAFRTIIEVRECMLV